MVGTNIGVGDLDDCHFYETRHILQIICFPLWIGNECILNTVLLHNCKKFLLDFKINEEKHQGAGGAARTVHYLAVSITIFLSVTAFVLLLGVTLEVSILFLNSDISSQQ